MIPKNDCFQDLNARTTISQEMSGTPSVDYNNNALCIHNLYTEITEYYQLLRQFSLKKRNIAIILWNNKV